MIVGVDEVTDVPGASAEAEQVKEIQKTTVLGLIERNTNRIYHVNWLVDPNIINYERLIVYLPTANYYRKRYDVDLQTTNYGLVENPTAVKTVWDVVEQFYAKESYAFVDEDHYDQFVDIQKAVENIRNLIKAYPMYENIMLDTENGLKAYNVLSILTYLDENERWAMIRALKYSRGSVAVQQRIAEKIISKIKVENGRDLMTQEQQVETFIEFSKQRRSDKEEKVSDQLLEKIEKSPLYEIVKEKLGTQGFLLSPTQQFNVLQQVGLLSKQGENLVYNLSDMGSGKTLMTVESIFLLDLKMAESFPLENVAEIRLPNKHLIAPKLSVKSSWIKTFELFYDVEEVSDIEYHLSFEYNGKVYKSKVLASPFTVKSNAIVVDQPLPESKYLRDIQEYLIIDEIHQLVQKSISRTKFFPKGVNPATSYKSFILSGTLSNLTTTQWYHYIRLMDIEYPHHTLRQSNSGISSSLVKREKDLADSIKQSAEGLAEHQHRYFDPENLTDKFEPITHVTKSNIENLYHHLFSSLVLNVRENHYEKIEDVLTEKQFGLRYAPELSDTPNFELFYNLVGDKAITAQSLQIAEELFGEQKTQHKADVIKTTSPLTADDLEILKTLHKITADHAIYKSKVIANRINNAILNLNDGLQQKNVYDLISQFASNNSRFLEYLTTLDLNILEKLPQSNLIDLPELEDTEKFAILKDILANEPDETHLIVVNDYNAMVQLSKALDIDHLSLKQVRNALSYQDSLDEMFEKQNVVVVPQDMIKSSLDLVQANRLIQYQLNSEISDIIQTQNRINRIGQTRETKAYYIATDVLQENLIELFLETYRNIKVAHKGIVELFVDMSSQINVVNDYIGKALKSATVDSEPLGQLSLFDETPYIVDIEETEDIEQEESVYNHPAQLVLFSLDDDYEAHQFAM